MGSRPAREWAGILGFVLLKDGRDCEELVIDPHNVLPFLAVHFLNKFERDVLSGEGHWGVPSPRVSRERYSGRSDVSYRHSRGMPRAEKGIQVGT